MPATGLHHAANLPSTFLGRSVFSLRRSPVIVSVDSSQEQEHTDLDHFQQHVADGFLRLASCHKSEILSLTWLQILLDDFLSCLDLFKALLVPGSTNDGPSPNDRHVSDLLDCGVKALDVCNAVSSGVDCLLDWGKQAKIASAALNRRRSGEGQQLRARRALEPLVRSMEEKSTTNRTAERSWSLGWRAAASSRHFRSNSWSVPRTWSAGRQLQAMSANIYPPRGAEMATLALPIYTMSAVLVFVMWVLAAAVPCQDRSAMALHYPAPPRHLAWAEPLIALQEKITEEWKKKEKGGRGGAGLLLELQRLEKCSLGLLEMGPEKEEEMRSEARELWDTCRRLEEGLIPLQRRVREVFHEIARSRTEVLDCFGRSATSVL